jgi:hypothetical protein
MKKLIICLAIAAVAVSCKKIQAGGNHGVIKLEEGVERYSDDEQTSGHAEDLNAATHKMEVQTADSAKAVAPRTDTAAVKPASDEKKPTTPAH